MLIRALGTTFLACFATLAVAQSAKSDLKVSMQETACKNALGPDGLSPSKDTEVSPISREAGDVLVEVRANSLCGETAADPHAQLSGDTLNLSWVWTSSAPNGMARECICTHSLEFRLGGLPEGNITVSARERRMMPAPKILYYICAENGKNVYTLYERPGCKAVQSSGE